MAFRALGGLSSAGGSVTLGMVADLWEPETQQEALAFVVFSSCAGSVVGAIAGGFIEQYCDWRWIFWAQLIFGVVAQAIHMLVPETRSTIMLDRHAQRLRKSGQDPNVYGPNEDAGGFWQRISFKEVTTLMWRPYKLLLTEPIVLFLSLLSGFSDALIFSAFDSFGMVLGLWDFSKVAIGLSFTAILLGNAIAWLSFLPVYRRDQKVLREKPASFLPERRLWWLLFLVVLEPIGLVGFGFGSLGPQAVHWMVPLVFALLIGIANYAIYLATVDYMLAAYGAEAGASATGCNGFCRDFLAGMAALYTKPFYTNIATGTRFQLPSATWILSGVAALLIMSVYLFYFKGAWFRKRSPYAQKLANEREQARADSAPNSRANSFEIVDG
jgi:MFS family permease